MSYSYSYSYSTSYNTYEPADKDESNVTIEYIDNNNNEEQEDDSNNQHQQDYNEQPATQNNSSYQQAAAPVTGDNLIDGGVNKHNEFRRAKGCPNLSWDANLAAGAQQWAEHVASRGGNLFHSTKDQNGGNGENLAQLWETDPKNQGGYFATATYNWVDGHNPGEHSERTMYDAGYRFPEAGHYMQVMWKNTTRVGMGYAFVPNSNFPGYGRKVIVCGRYSPPGNYPGQTPY